jgi:hypothetical protein
VKKQLDESIGVIPKRATLAFISAVFDKLYLIIGLKNNCILLKSTKCLLFYKTILIYSVGPYADLRG